jgi:hypothetical protein
VGEGEGGERERERERGRGRGKSFFNLESFLGFLGIIKSFLTFWSFCIKLIYS